MILIGLMVECSSLGIAGIGVGGDGFLTMDGSLPAADSTTIVPSQAYIKNEVDS